MQDRPLRHPMRNFRSLPSQTIFADDRLHRRLTWLGTAEAEFGWRSLESGSYIMAAPTSSGGPAAGSAAGGQ